MQGWPTWRQCLWTESEGRLICDVRRAPVVLGSIRKADRCLEGMLEDKLHNEALVELIVGFELERIIEC